MPRLNRGAVVVALLALAAVSPSGCEKRPGRPTPPQISGTPQTLEIRGHTAVHRPGDAAQLMAVAVYANGVAEDATSRGASFGVGRDSRVATVTPGGYLKALAYGRATIYVNWLQQTASAEARIVPEGAFLVSGRVIEEGSWRVPIAGAKVEVVMPGETVSTVSDGDGLYALPATAGATLRVEAANFYAQSFPVIATGDSQMDLPLRRSVQTVAGTYVLSFTASPSCTFPSNALARRYIATLSESQSDVTVILSGANFAGWGTAGFAGTRNGNTVRFSIEDDWWFSFTEVLGDGQYLAFQGAASGTIEPGKIVTLLDGTVTYISGTAVNGCTAKDHRLDFAR